jgi:nucleosome binding factor SPN SPT16 subunit
VTISMLTQIYKSNKRMMQVCVSTRGNIHCLWHRVETYRDVTDRRKHHRVETYRAVTDRRKHHRVETYRAVTDRRKHHRVETYRAVTDRRKHHRVETYRDVTDRCKHCGNLRFHVPTFFQATGQKMINCACSASS